MKPADFPLLSRMAKAVTPSLAGVIHGLGLTNATQLFINYMSVLVGQGAGSGWDSGETKAAARFISSAEPVIVDCGANTGEWSAGLRARLGGRGRWYAIEPNPACVTALGKLAYLDVTARAASDVVGSATLRVPKGSSSLGSLHVRQDSFVGDIGVENYVVETTTIDAFAEEKHLESIDFLKLDLEGHELTAMRGAARVLRDHVVRTLSFEFGSANVHSRVFLRDLYVLLVDNGYRIYRIVPGGRVVAISEYYEDLEYYRGATNYIATVLAPSEVA